MSIYQKRLKDWRHGAIVYQVIVDRFSPTSQHRQKFIPLP
jgi:hypothetical protein